MATRVRLSNFTLTSAGLEYDEEVLAAPDQPPAPPPDQPPDQPPPVPVRPPSLPEGYDSDERVGFRMLTTAMDAHGLDPIGVQGHGALICQALNATYPGLHTYPHPQSDAVMWPGFGDLDVTIDSGNGGWSFQANRNTPYDPAQYQAWAQAQGLTR